jgi:uncharacterized protein (DUF924 family)
MNDTPLSDERAPPPEAPVDASRVLDFWFGEPGSAVEGTDRPEWFRKDAAFDAGIRARFGPLIEQALRGELESWSGSARGALAQIVLLDQFTRNTFRDSPRAFAGDARALDAARAMVGKRQDEALTPRQRSFVYLPFEHAEGIEMQEESVRLFTRLAEAAPETAGSLDYAHQHHAIVQRFGRFPHRNAILGRRSTAEELAFLEQPGSGF